MLFHYRISELLREFLVHVVPVKDLCVWTFKIRLKEHWCLGPILHTTREMDKRFLFHRLLAWVFLYLFIFSTCEIPSFFCGILDVYWQVSFCLVRFLPSSIISFIMNVIVILIFIHLMNLNGKLKSIPHFFPWYSLYFQYEVFYAFD